MSGLSILLFSILFMVALWLLLPGAIDRILRPTRRAAMPTSDKPDALADNLFDRWSSRS